MVKKVDKNEQAKFGLSNFVVFLNQLIEDSTKYFPGSYFYTEMKSNTYRINAFENDLRTLEKYRKFDISLLQLVQEYYMSSIENALMHKNQDLYFGVIYNIMESLESRLIDLSEPKNEVESFKVKSKNEKESKNDNIYFQKQSTTDCFYFF